MGLKDIDSYQFFLNSRRNKKSCFGIAKFPPYDTYIYKFAPYDIYGPIC